MTEQPPGNYPPPQPYSGGAYPPPGQGQVAQPNNHLVFAILTTLFCCLPLGIVSIVKASQVNGLWAQGRYPEAQQSAASAKKWAMWSAILGIVVIVVYAIVAVAGGMSFDTLDTS
jgi:predicted secreted protein